MVLGIGSARQSYCTLVALRRDHSRGAARGAKSVPGPGRHLVRYQRRRKAEDRGRCLSRVRDSGSCATW